MTLELPEGLVLGAATAAYQIEGAVREGGRGPSIWDTFAHTPGRTHGGETGDVADDHYRRLEQDLDLMAEIGLDAYRFSIAWSRILPTGAGAVNPAGVDFYSRLVDGLLERGIRPVATLYHWDLPQPLEDAGGWPERATAHAFAEYASVVGAALGDRVHTWTTFNEPWCSAYLGYGSGAHAPGRQGRVEPLRAVHHLNLAHGLGVQALRSVVRQDAEVSVTLNLHVFRPVGPTGQEARDKVESLANDAFLSPMLEGRLSDRLLATTAEITDWSFVQDGDLDVVQQPLDSLGINYYRTIQVRTRESTTAGRQDDGHAATAFSQWPGAEDVEFLPAVGPTTEMGWNIDPTGLTGLLLDLHGAYPGLPLLITENGAAFPDVVAEDGRVHDAQRVEYLRSHIEATVRAVQLGADVRGYYAWSLMDNFEWALGFAKGFGLVHVDYVTQRRTLKDSGRWYRDLIASRRLDLDQR